MAKASWAGRVIAESNATVVVEGNRYFPPDTEAAKFWLRNRRRKQWRELIEHEHTNVTDDKLRELEEAGIRARDAHRR